MVKLHCKGIPHCLWHLINKSYSKVSLQFFTLVCTLTPSRSFNRELLFLPYSILSLWTSSMTFCHNLDLGQELVTTIVVMGLSLKVQRIPSSGCLTYHRPIVCNSDLRKMFLGQSAFIALKRVSSCCGCLYHTGCIKRSVSHSLFISQSCGPLLKLSC